MNSFITFGQPRGDLWPVQISSRWENAYVPRSPDLIGWRDYYYNTLLLTQALFSSPFLCAGTFSFHTFGLCACASAARVCVRALYEIPETYNSEHRYRVSTLTSSPPIFHRVFTPSAPCLPAALPSLCLRRDLTPPPAHVRSDRSHDLLGIRLFTLLCSPFFTCIFRRRTTKNTHHSTASARIAAQYINYHTHKAQFLCCFFFARCHRHHIAQSRLVHSPRRTATRTQARPRAPFVFVCHRFDISFVHFLPPPNCCWQRWRWRSRCCSQFR